MPTWFCVKKDSTVGPFGEGQLGQLIAAGKITHSDLLWRDGFGDWTRAGTIEGLFQTPPPIPQEPAPQPREYKALRIDSNDLLQQVDSEGMSSLLNEHAAEGWAVKAIAEFDPPSMTGYKRAFLIILERSRARLEM